VNFTRPDISSTASINGRTVKLAPQSIAWNQVTFTPLVNLTAPVPSLPPTQAYTLSFLSQSAGANASSTAPQAPSMNVSATGVPYPYFVIGIGTFALQGTEISSFTAFCQSLNISVVSSVTLINSASPSSYNMTQVYTQGYGSTSDIAYAYSELINAIDSYSTNHIVALYNLQAQLDALSAAAPANTTATDNSTAVVNDLLDAAITNATASQQLAPISQNDLSSILSAFNQTIASVPPFNQTTGTLLMRFSKVGISLYGQTLAWGNGAQATALFYNGDAAGSTVVTGSFVAFQPELNAVINTINSTNILKLQSVNDHYIGENPTVTYLNYIGIGAPNAVGQAVARVVIAAGQTFNQFGG
jgi:hypothetical protein